MRGKLPLSLGRLRSRLIEILHALHLWSLQKDRTIKLKWLGWALIGKWSLAATCVTRWGSYLLRLWIKRKEDICYQHINIIYTQHSWHSLQIRCDISVLTYLLAISARNYTHLYPYWENIAISVVCYNNRFRPEIGTHLPPIWRLDCFDWAPCRCDLTSNWPGSVDFLEIIKVFPLSCKPSECYNWKLCSHGCSVLMMKKRKILNLRNRSL